MIDRRTWLWVEVVLCLAYAVILSIFGLAMTAHWIVVTIVWGAHVPAGSLVLTLYAASTSLGIAGIFILLCTQFGATAKRSSLSLTRIGLLAGFATSLLIPGGDPLSGWDRDKVLALFASVLPCLCFAHFAYLARRSLF